MGQGKKLQSLLKERNMSVTKLANETGISSNTLYAIIKRDSNISTDTLSKVANALQISIDGLGQLLTDETLNEENPDNVTHLLDVEFNDTLMETRQLIEKLNHLTMEYQKSLDMLRDLTKEREHTKLHKQQLEQKIQELDNRIAVLSNEIANRKIELDLIRNKIL